MDGVNLGGYDQPKYVTDDKDEAVGRGKKCGEAKETRSRST
jgi:hypothetical protein